MISACPAVPLGKDAKSVAKFENHNVEQKPQIDESIRLNKRKRWEMKRYAEKLLPNHAVNNCLRVPQKWKNENGKRKNIYPKITVCKSADTGAAFYGGLHTCSNVWACPVCSAKISERRRKELQEIENIWKSRRGKLYMMTFTFPHKSGQNLKDLLEQFGNARRKYFFAGRAWRDFAKNIGLEHSIYALETTYGNNGWHIHTHFLMLINPDKANQIPLAENILSSWQLACIKAGLEKPNEHGLQIQDAAKVSSYITKWGADLELTKQICKTGRNGSRSPFDLLRDYGKNSDIAAGGLFKEYVKAFKGKRQLVFSKGLRADLGLAQEKTDSELAAEIEKTAEILGCLTRNQWKLVLWHDARMELLEMAEDLGWFGVEQTIDALWDMARPFNP